MICSVVSPSSALHDALAEPLLARIVGMAPAPCRIVIPTGSHRARVLRAWVQQRPGEELPAVATMQGFVMELARTLGVQGRVMADDEADLLLQLALHEAGERFRPAGLSVQRLVRWKQEGHTVGSVLEQVADAEALDEQGIRDVQRIVKVWAAYEAVKGASHRDRGDLFQDLCAYVDSHPPPADTPTIVLATHGLTAVDERLLTALGEAGWDVGIVLAERTALHLGDRSADVASRLLLNGWTLHEAEPRHPAAVAMHTCATPHDEIRRILSAIKEEIRNGVSPRAIAVVVPSAGPYDTLLRDLARRSGVPLDRTDVRSLATAGDATALYAACQVVIRQWEREDVSRLSLSGQVRSEIQLAALNAAADHVRVQGGFGSTRWRERLHSTYQALHGVAVEHADADDRSVRQTLSLLASALSTLDVLESVLTPPSRSMTPASFETYLTDNLAEGLGIAITPALRETIRWYRTICDRYELPPQPLAEHCSRWWAIVRARTIDASSGTGGIAVLRTADARLGSYARVFAPGFVDGVFPARRQDAVEEFFLPEADGTMEAEGLQDLLHAAESDGRLTVTRATTMDEDDTLASVFWDDLHEWLQSGALTTAGETNDVFSEPPLPVLLNPDERSVWVDGAQFDGASRQLGLHAAEIPSSIAEAVSDATQVALNPSRIDMARSCAYRYYGTRLLRLEQAVDVDEMLSPLERGNLMHAVAQAFLSERQTHTLGTTISREDLASAQVRIDRTPIDQLLPALIETFRRARAKFPHGYLYDEAEGRAFVDSGQRAGLLRRWLVKEIAQQQRDGFYPVLFELEIEDSVQIGGGRTEDIKIRVDRIDVRIDEDRIVARVIDYKTSRAPTRTSVMDGSSSQMPLYMAAVEQWFAKSGIPVQVLDAAYHTFGRSLFSKDAPAVSVALSRERVIKKTGEVVDELALALPEIMPGIDVIRGQAFAVQPAEHACLYCHLNEVCRIDDWGVVPKPPGIEGTV